MTRSPGGQEGLGWRLHNNNNHHHHDSPKHLTDVGEATAEIGRGILAWRIWRETKTQTQNFKQLCKWCWVLMRWQRNSVSCFCRQRYCKHKHFVELHDIGSWSLGKKRGKNQSPQNDSVFIQLGTIWNRNSSHSTLRGAQDLPQRGGNYRIRGSRWLLRWVDHWLWVRLKTIFKTMRICMEFLSLHGLWGSDLLTYINFWSRMMLLSSANYHCQVIAFP